MAVNEQVSLQSNDPVLNSFVKLLGIQLRQTEDQLTRDMLASTASFINCTGGYNGDNPTEITRSDIDEITETLVNNDAYTTMYSIEAADKFATAPVPDSFFALCHAKLIKDLNLVQGFIQKHQYGNPSAGLRTEWGHAGHLRFLVSSVGSVSANASNLGADVYNIFCVGMEAYATIEQDEYSSQFVYIPPHIAGGPLALNCNVGWKMAEVPVICNDLWVLNLRATRSS